MASLYYFISAVCCVVFGAQALEQKLDTVRLDGTAAAATRKFSSFRFHSLRHDFFYFFFFCHHFYEFKYNFIL